MASLLLSLSLALGILVGDVGGYRLLTSAHARESPCARSGNRGTLVIKSVNIAYGLIRNGITVRNVNVNGTVLEQALIAGSVHLANAKLVGTNGVIVGGDGGDGIAPSGVIVGGDGGRGTPCINGVIVGGDGGSNVAPSGVIVGGDGGDSISPSGVIVGGIATTDEVNLGGASVSSSGAAVGGTLTGDDITITDGVITGQNLLLSGAAIDGGSVNGTVTSVSISPAD